MNTDQWIEKAERLFMTTYTRFPAVMVEGKGCRLTDSQGREYLDFLSGIAVANLGHCHPAVTRAVAEQLERLVHVSNLFYTTPQVELAELLVSHSFADRVFFANSGAEANEAAFKLARKAAGPDRYEIISLEGSFHGRTLAAVAATGQSKFHEGFEPLPAGFSHAPFGDLDALASMITGETCAILVEPIQGESGVRPLPLEYLRGIRELCDRHGLLLIFDEVQVGMGRTGTLFAYQQFGVEPDILTLAKALGGGLPIGAVLAREEISRAFTPGSHASTFGGGPVVCAAAVAVLRELLAEGFLDSVREKGAYLNRRLCELAARFPNLAASARGMGMIQALVLTEEGRARGAEMVKELFANGLIANFAGNAVIRLAPPLVVSREEIDQGISILASVLASMA